jgi:NAD+ synthase (glutamine-hydrolysing)
VKAVDKHAGSRCYREHVERLRLAGAQIDPVIGDIDGNVDRIVSAYREAVEQGAHMVIFPELAVTAYPPEDLVFKPDFLAASQHGMRRAAAATGPAAALIGFVDSTHAGPANAAALCRDGEVLAVYHKILLPNYSVFDEERYFVPGSQVLLAWFGRVCVAITICEDLWFPWGPLPTAAAAGAEVVVSVNGSPYRYGKSDRLAPMLATRAADHGVHLLWVNQVGGQDELVFEGQSTAIDPQGRIRARAAAFEEELLLVDVMIEEGATARLADRPRRTPATSPHPGYEVRQVRVMDELPDPGPPVRQRLARTLSVEEGVYRALVVATGDYVVKNGFERVLIGMSGGIDSSLVAAIATDALGRQRVTGVAMPSEHSSAASLDDARAVADNLGVELLTLPIHEPYDGFMSALKQPFAGTEPGIAEENLQARVRGTLLMSISNKFGHLVLTTGNKSELAVGYSTLYGDMAGGFAVIRDVPKTLVYALARWRNELGVVIPQSVLDKPPTAELRPGQLDTDSLPPYEVLDPILDRYIEDDASAQEIIGEGFDPEVVERVIRMVDNAEYKRRQSPPGPKVTGRSFGKDRRLPITNRFHGFSGSAG